jgi:hypothetical protein
MMDFPTFLAVSVSPPGTKKTKQRLRRLRGESPKRSQQLQTVISWRGALKNARVFVAVGQENMGEKLGEDPPFGRFHGWEGVEG